MSVYKIYFPFSFCFVSFFFFLFFSESVLSFNAGVSLNRSLNNTLKHTAVLSKLIILCLIAQYLFYFIPYITEVTEILILFQYLLITHWFQSLFYHPMSLSNSLSLTHCSVLASRICFSGFSYFIFLSFDASNAVDSTFILHFFFFFFFFFFIFQSLLYQPCICFFDLFTISDTWLLFFTPSIYHILYF